MKHCFAILALIALGSPVPSQADETTDDQTWVTQAMAQTQAIGNRTEFELGSDSNGPGANVPVARQKLHTLHMAQALAHRLKPELADWERRNGSDMNDLYQRFGTDKGHDIWMAKGQVQRFIEAVEAAGPQNARNCIELVETWGIDANYIKRLNPIVQVKAVEDARGLAGMCDQFAPDDAGIKQAMARLEPKLEATLAEFVELERKALEAREWKPNASIAQASTLAQAVKQFLGGHREWGGNTAKGTQVLAVTVQGDWFVAERNLLGQPAKWGLPVHVAIRTNAHKPEVAQVFNLSIITPTATQAAPFEGYWVGNTWMVLASRIN